ncbi:MAG TPA: hypothetical protein DHV36_07400 [Desulfobacteraceae bacterium]|nr:hypothetical protein [Desulfobacteraceae bacterium]|tara:strand:- start:1529 stop:1837 length:309 start_codon:yes stop_codon:yes gene_type:complete
MCNHCNDHSHHHHHDHPEIVQLMPVQNNLYAVYQTDAPLDFSVENGKEGIGIVPVLFMGLIRHGEKTMVEGFFASTSINSCEETHGFKGYASSLAHAEKLYA